MPAQLRLRRGTEPEQRISMDHDRITFGRALDNDFASPADSRLSRQHFVIEREGVEWIVRDLDSRNGTFVNGKRIAVRRLSDGDRITAGGMEVHLQTSEALKFDTITTLDNALESSLASNNPAVVERHMRALVDAGRLLASRHTPDQWWDSLLGISVAALEAERAVIVLTEGARGWIVVARRGNIEISESVGARVVQERVSLLVRDVALDEDLQAAPSLVLNQVRSLMAAPLQTNDQVLGIIYADRATIPGFTPQELNLLTIIANMAALRLEQARLIEVAEGERERIREMEREAAAHRRALEAAEALRYAETRAILAETAASMGKLAAAISHELNTPLGALNSSVETLLTAISRGREGADVKRTLSVIESLSTTIHNSTSRLSEIIGRLQRFTNLDRAELQAIDLGQFLRDVVATRRTSAQGEVEVDPSVSQRISSRPHQLAGVFSSLLERLNGKARLTAREVERGTEVKLHAPELMLSEQDIADLFDPAFRVAAGRIASANWNLFSARQIIRELGGDVQADSDNARGTVFTVVIADLSA